MKALGRNSLFRVSLHIYVEERNEMMTEFIHSFFHSRLFTIKIAKIFPNGSKPRLDD